MRTCRLLVAVLAVAASLGGAHATTARPGRDVPPSPELTSRLAEFDRVQDAIRSLSAEFTKTSANPLLREPAVSRGRILMSKPGSVLWEFREPEEMRFLIAGDTYTGYFPERRRAERKNIRRWSETIFRFLGLGQGSEELKKFYDISLGQPGPEMKGTYLLDLEPKKRRVRKRVDTVRLWVDARSHLPVQFAYHTSQGAEETIRFRDVRVNPDLSAGLFTLDIPKDVAIVTGMSGLGGLGGAPAPEGEEPR